jgi:hypothetical protein
VLQQLHAVNSTPATIVSPRSPRARPKGVSTATTHLPATPPTVIDALKHILTEAVACSGPSKQLPLSESAVLSMPLIKDIDTLLSSPPPQSVGIPHVCRHPHGTALHDTDPCAGGPVVQAIDGLLACLEWRFLPAIPVVTDFVAMMDAGRRKWTVQEANVRLSVTYPYCCFVVKVVSLASQKLRGQLEMATQSVDEATDSKSPDVSGATVVQVLLTALHRIITNSRQYPHLHSQHAVFLHSRWVHVTSPNVKLPVVSVCVWLACRSPVLSSIARSVLLSSWQGDAVGAGGSVSGVPPGISEVVLSMVLLFCVAVVLSRGVLVSLIPWCTPVYAAYL